MTVPPQQYSMYSQPIGQHSAGPPTISRYVAYDPYTPTASTLAPIPSAQTYNPPASQPAVQMNAFQNPIMSNNAMTQLMGGTPSAPVQGSSSSYVAAVSDTQVFAPPPAEAPLAPHIASPPPPPAAAAAAIEGGGAASFFSPTVTSTSAAVSAPQVTAAVTQLTTDASGMDSLSDSFCEVEILDASSSSVL